jgi:hypothetical protein
VAREKKYLKMKEIFFSLLKVSKVQTILVQFPLSLQPLKRAQSMGARQPTQKRVGTENYTTIKISKT